MLGYKLRAEVGSALEELSRNVGLRHMCRCRGGGSDSGEVGPLLSPDALVRFVKGRAVCAWAGREEASGVVRMATQVLAFRRVGSVVRIGGLVEGFDPVGFLGFTQYMALCSSGDWAEGDPLPLDQVLVHVVALRWFMSANPVWVPDTVDSEDSGSGSDDPGNITSSVDDEGSDGSFPSNISDFFSGDEFEDGFVEEKQEKHDMCQLETTDKYFCMLNKADHSLLDSGEPFEYLSDHELDKCSNSSRTSPVNKYVIHQELPMCRTNRIHFYLDDAIKPLTGHQIYTCTNSRGNTGRCLRLEEEDAMKWVTDSDEPWDFDPESVCDATGYPVASVVELPKDTVSQNNSSNHNKDIVDIYSDTTNEQMIETLDHNNTSVSGNIWNAEEKDAVPDFGAEWKRNYSGSLSKIAAPSKEHLSLIPTSEFDTCSPLGTLKQLRFLASDPLQFWPGYFDFFCANLLQFKDYLLKTSRGADYDHHFENKASVLESTWMTKQKEEDYSDLGYAPKQNCSSLIPQIASFVKEQLTILPAGECNTCSSRKTLEQLHFLASDPLCFELEDLDFYCAYLLKFRSHSLEISESAICDHLLKMASKKPVFNFEKNSIIVSTNAKNHQDDDDGICKNDKSCNAEVSHELLPTLSNGVARTKTPRFSHVSNDVEDHTVTRVHEKNVLDQAICLDQHEQHRVQALYPMRRLYMSPLVPDSPIVDKDVSLHRSLHMKFPRDFRIPSKQELERKFTVFGHLDRSRTKIFSYTGSAEVVFLHPEDAQTAYQFARRKKVYRHADVRFWFDRYEKYRKGRNNQTLSLGRSALKLKSCLKRPHAPMMKNLKRKHSVKFSMDVKTSSLNREATAKCAAMDISDAMLRLLIKCDKLVLDIKKNLGLKSYYSMFTDGYSNLSNSGR